MRYKLPLFILLAFAGLLAYGKLQVNPSSSVKAYALRLKPHQDLKKELYAFVKEHGLKAACIVSCVGSLERASLRMANKSETTTMEDKFEIVSLVGTLQSGYGHLHLSVSDGTGRTIGGHLQDGSLVYTTAEIVLMELTDLEFIKAKDPTYGYDELSFRRRG